MVERITTYAARLGEAPPRPLGDGWRVAEVASDQMHEDVAGVVWERGAASSRVGSIVAMPAMACIGGLMAAFVTTMVLVVA